MDAIFVYGTLKEGFPNIHVNRGTRVPGEYVTVERWPLYVATENHIPWLVPRAGEGHPVIGQLFEVDDTALALMDLLERVDEPLDWYTRREIEVRDRTDAAAAPLRVFVYFGSEARWRAGPVHAGPLPEYLLSMAQHYRTDAHDATVRAALRG